MRRFRPLLGGRGKTSVTDSQDNLIDCTAMPVSKSKHRDVRLAALLYVFVTLVFSLCASKSLWSTHTPHNHYAWLADAFLHGRLSLQGPPPIYSGGNDFALFENRWYIVFPPFPALLLMPFVALAGRVDAFRDGVFFLMLAGLAPAGLFLALQRLRYLKLSVVSESAALILSALFALGTVYFFTSIQGTVWFAGHVIATTAVIFYLLASIGAQHPILAALALSAAIGTRSHLGLSGIFFVLEAIRIARKPNTTRLADCDWQLVVRRLLPFTLLSAAGVCVLMWYNWARFHSPFEVGYRFLQIAWQGRIAKWGMFDYHYLARNLGIILTGLPYVNHDARSAPFQINGHGLALWITSPFFLWLLWPNRRSPVHAACYVTLLATALPSLLYQNSGWVQFGQRFSNDYSPWLFVLLAIGFERLGRLFRVAAVFSLIVNLFGALTFQRQGWNKYYYIEGTQKVVYEPD